MKKLFASMAASTAVFSMFLLPTQTLAVDVSETCPVSIDNDLSDWETIDPLFSEPGDTTGIDYYWDGSTWSTIEPDTYELSTNVQQMADLENIKICNDITTMYLYVDAQHPMFGLFDPVTETYEEFGDPDDEENPTMPEAFDNWMVFEMQKEGSSNTFFYAIHLQAEEGDAGLESGPAIQALYEDDGDGEFDPDVDTLLAEFDTGGNPDEFEGDPEDQGKNYDQEGGLEVGLDLVNEDGEGLFPSTEIEYGDTLTITVSMIPNANFESAGVSPLAVGPTIASLDETDSFEYVVAEVGVQDLDVAKKKIKRYKVTAAWTAVSIADRYKVRLYTKKGKTLRTLSATKASKMIKKLQPNRTYKVKVRAIIGDVKTPWSDAEQFKTKKKK